MNNAPFLTITPISISKPMSSLSQWYNRLSNSVWFLIISRHLIFYFGALHMLSRTELMDVNYVVSNHSSPQSSGSFCYIQLFNSYDMNIFVICRWVGIGKKKQTTRQFSFLKNKALNSAKIVVKNIEHSS